MNKKIIFSFLLFLLAFLFTSCKSSTIDTKTSSVVHPLWSKNVTIYEVNIRQYTEEGTFSAFQKQLPKLKELGVQLLWLMPIHPIGEKNRKGELGSYYAATDYKAIAPEYGTEKDFRNLVDAIHAQGMYIIIDWVANHTAWDHMWTKSNPEYYTKDFLGNFVPPVPDWHDVIDLNYDNQEMRTEMIDALKYWVSTFDIDGYRCDVAIEVPVDFWDAAKIELNNIKEVFMLAEAEGSHLHRNAFDMTYGWDLHHYINEVAQGKKDANDFYNRFSKKRLEYGSKAYRMNFTSNHDENSWNGTVEERLGDAAEVMAVLTFTIDGMPLIYSGQEAGMNKRLKFFEKDVIEWKEDKYFALYQKLISLKKNNIALWNGGFGSQLKRVVTSNQKDIFAFTRQKGNDKIFVITNLSNKKKKVKLVEPNLSGNYTNYFTNQKIELFDDMTFEIEPWGYKVFTGNN
ncbi:MAG: alpha-amylase family glycosyl hydrolase [Melioribacteraceae bacterium]